jgi:DNA polymerase-1
VRSSPPARALAVPGRLRDVSLHFVDNLDELDACRRWASEQRETPLGYDTESAGLDPHRHPCRLIQIGDKRHGWAFPAAGWSGAAIEILTRYQGQLVAHNSPYDNRVLAVGHGWSPPWERIDDTLIMSHLVNSLRPAGLKDLGKSEIDPMAAAGEEVLKDAMARNHWTWATVPVDYPGYWAYGALDPVLTCWIWEAKAPAVYKQYRQPYDLERATARICAAMMTAGLAVDVPFVEKTITEWSTWELQALNWLSQHHNIGSVNSNAQLGAAFNLAGIPTAFWTGTGMPQMDKEALAFYASQYPEQAPLISTVIRARKVDDVVGKRLAKFLAMRADDDRLHATINTCRARTSRMSITDPSLQNLDRDEAVVRGAFVPSPGNAFVTIDADQIEARLCAHFSGDPRMIAMFAEADRTGVDFFRQMAAQIHSVPVEMMPKTDHRRQVTKNAMYSWQFAAGLEKMAVTAGVPVEQMRPVRDGLNILYPGVGRLMQQLIRQGKASGGHPSVTTPTGRRLYCNPGKEYTLLNTEIQGHAGEILKQGIVALDAAGYGPYMRVPVHDELLCEFPREHAAEALAGMTEILTDRDTYAVPITWAGEIQETRWTKS